jgi:cysteine desulfurase
MTTRTPIYLDYSATTPVDPRVLEAMLPYFSERFGNAASKTHAFGWAAESATIAARNQVAALLGAQVDEQSGSPEIIFTSGATEADNLAIKGVAAAYADKGRHLITQATEHHAVLDSFHAIQKQGFEVTVLPVDGNGRISAEQVAEAIRPDTTLVSIMWANNETGTVQPIRAIGEVCRQRKVLFHTDATQAIARDVINLADEPIDLLSLSAHKFYGPKGAGALYVRRRHPRISLQRQFDGGGQEMGMRSGTLNVPGIIGLGMAAEIAKAAMADELPRLARLRDRLETSIRDRLDGVRINGDEQHRLPHVTNMCFAAVDGSSLLWALEDLAVSSGSACTSAAVEPSFVLRAMGIPDDWAQSAIRFSLGRYTTEAEVDRAADIVISAVKRLRQ